MIDIDVVGQLFPNLFTMLVQLCSTLVIFLVFKKFLWASVQKMLNERSEKMQEGLQQAEEARKEALEDREKAKAEIKEARDTSRSILDKTKQESEALKASMLEDAKQEAKMKVDSAKKEIEFQKQQAQNDMVKEMVDVAMAATEKLIGEKATAEDDAKQIEAFVKEAKRV